MKRILSTLLIGAACAAHAQKLPQPSPPGSVEQIVGLTKVEVNYSRPSAKGRKVFGDLVPYGSVWRTGANQCTTVEFDGRVMVEGKPIPAGKYSLFTIPAEDAWMVIFNTNTELWGEGDRKPEEDILSVKVKPVKSDFTETFTIGFDAVKDDKARMDLQWENVRVGIELYADATQQAIANIKEALAKPDADFRAYHNSARFCVDRNMMPREALGWATKSVELEKKFWNLHTLALAQAQNSRYEEAIATAQASLKMAEEAKYDAYIKMNQQKIEEWSKLVPAKPSKGK
jgi:hypothetical protein